jgi:hypothetical protein
LPCGGNLPRFLANNNTVLWYIWSMVDAPVQSAFFDPIIPLITSARYAPTGDLLLLEIAVPASLLLDFDTVNQFFIDATLTGERGKPQLLKGAVKDASVARYIWAKITGRWA